jgi:hypothetical protein
VKKLLAVALSALFLAGTSPALAVSPTLPEGDELFLLPCDVDYPNDRQLLWVNLVNNTLEASGTGLDTASNLDCAVQGAVLPGTDWFYFIDWVVVGEDLFEYLVRVNLATGVVEEIGRTVTREAVNTLSGLAIGPDGRAYALDERNLYEVNLATGELTFLNEPNIFDVNSGFPYGFSYDPMTNKFYVFEGGAYEIYEIDVVTGDLTHVIDSAILIMSMAFDSDGNLWVNGVDNKVRRTSLPEIDNFAAMLATENLVIGTTTVDSYSLGILHAEGDDDSAAEELAPTGPTDLSSVAGFAGLASLAGLAGLAAVAIRRRANR